MSWSWKISEIEKRIEEEKQRLLDMEKHLELEKQKELERDKLRRLLWSGRKKYNLSSYFMREAVLNSSTCRSLIVEVNTIDDLKKITWEDWKKREFLRVSYYREPTKFCKGGKESWLRLQECIKRSHYYK